MMYEIINPSDQYYFEAANLEVAAVCICILGQGHYGGKPIDEKDPEIPMFLFENQDEWFQKQFNKTCLKSLQDVKENNLPELIKAFESVTLGSPKDYELFKDAMDAIEDPIKKETFRTKWMDKKQTSLNDIGGYAAYWVKHLRGLS